MNPSFDFTGATVLVTGGGHGVGAALCRAFAAAGAHVIINCFRSPDAAAKTLAGLPGPGSGELVRASVADSHQAASMFEQIADRHDRLDVLVNNAASGTFRVLDQVTPKDWKRAWETNVMGALHCSQQARPLLTRAPMPAIVNMSSMGATTSAGPYIGVGPSKAALESLTRYLATNWGPDGIRVNAVSSGFVEGEAINRFDQPGELVESVRAATPLRRIGTGSDLSALVLFLASAGAGWITGQVIHADGGLLITCPGIPPTHLIPTPGMGVRADSAMDATPVGTVP